MPEVTEKKSTQITAEKNPVTSANPGITATANTAADKKSPGLSFRRFFTKPVVSPYEEVEWELRASSSAVNSTSLVQSSKNCWEIYSSKRSSNLAVETIAVAQILNFRKKS